MFPNDSTNPDPNEREYIRSFTLSKCIELHNAAQLKLHGVSVSNKFTQHDLRTACLQIVLIL
jgi:hypothetical protein